MDSHKVGRFFETQCITESEYTLVYKYVKGNLSP